jgi:undecaprenyl-diphosphatase
MSGPAPEQRVALRRIVTLLLARYRAGIAELPEGALPRWVRTIAVGLAGMVLLIVALVAAGRRLQGNGSLEWETQFLTALGTRGPFSLSTAVWWQTFGTDITLIILIILTAGIAVWARRPLTAWSIALAFLVMDPTVRIGWFLWDRARPVVLYEGVASPAFHSFPSGHTGKTLAVYGILVFIWMRASRSWIERVCALLILAAIAIVVPLGRLSMGVHWPTDILAGWIIGLYWLAVLASALRFERHRDQRAL